MIDTLLNFEWGGGFKLRRKERRRMDARGEYVKSFSNHDGWVFFAFAPSWGHFFLQIQRCYMTVFVLRDFYVSLCTYVSGVRMMGNTGFGSLLGSEIHEAISPPSPPFPPLLPWRDRWRNDWRKRGEEKPTTSPFSPHIKRSRNLKSWISLFLSLLTFSSRPFGIFLDIPPVFPHKHPFLKCHNHLNHVLLSSRNNLQHLLSLSQTHTPAQHAW